MTQDYKVEMKPTYWEVILRSGEYSDYSERHLFFAANDENEVWNFLCRYVESNLPEEKFCFSYAWKPYCMCWRDKKFFSNKLTEEDRDYVNDVDVEINRLNVIYFKN